MIKRPIYAPAMEGTSPVIIQLSGSIRAAPMIIGFLPKASEYGGKIMLPRAPPIPYLYKQMRKNVMKAKTQCIHLHERKSNK